MVLKASLPSHAAYLATAAVHSAIEAVLRRRGVASDDVEDLRQVVLAQALETSTPPPDLEQCIGLVRKMARDVAVDHFRRRARRSKYDAGPYENPDDRASIEASAGEDRLDFGKQIAWVQARINDGTISARQAGMLASAADGISGVTIAREWGLTDQTVRNELSRARKTARLSWAAYLGTSVVAAFVLYALWAQHPPKEGASGARERERSAYQLRGRAMQECRSERWAECLQDLDQAAILDPAGDAAAEVQSARAGIERNLQKAAPSYHLEPSNDLGKPLRPTPPH